MRRDMFLCLTGWALATSGPSPAGAKPAEVSAAEPGPARAAAPPLGRAATLAIEASFQSQVPALFGDNLAFAFICGSVAQGHARLDHDIDSLVVVRARDAEMERRYLAWVAALHRAHGMVLDEAYPAEILSEAELAAVLAALPATSMSLHFNGSTVFDRVTWADMLAAGKSAIVGDAPALARAAAQAAPHVARWHRELLAELAAHGDQAYLAERFMPGADLASKARALAPLSLPRVIRRVVPLPEAPPPAGTGTLAEAWTMQPPLLTRDLLLRRAAPADARFLWALSRRSRWRPGTPQLFPAPLANEAAARAWIRARADARARGQSTAWVVASRRDGQALGLVALPPQPAAPGDGRGALFAMRPDLDDGGRLGEQAAARLDELARQAAAIDGVGG